jgi:hypothetical protein
METERKRQLALGALAVILALVLYQMVYRAAPATSSAPAPSSNGERTLTRAAQSESAPAEPDVHLQALKGDRPRPASSERNLFRFATKAAPPPPPTVLSPSRGTPPPPVVVAPVPPGPPQPAPPPPITLKFIGIIEATERAQKIAILSDGRNVPFYGREGDIIEGRYRILKIGVESVELAYVDGRGRQTIRLTGG